MKTENMTVSKALRLAKKLRGEVAQLTTRTMASLNWEEGREPTATFETLKAQLEAKTARLISLKAAIAESNASVKVTVEGKIMSAQEAIFLMAELKGERAFFESLRPRYGETNEFQQKVIEDGEHKGQIGHKEVKRVFKSALTEDDIRAKVEALQARMDALNDALEFHNHGTSITLSGE